MSSDTSAVHPNCAHCGGEIEYRPGSSYMASTDGRVWHMGCAPSQRITRTNPDGLREALEAVTAIADEYTDDQPPQTKARQIVKRARATLAAMRP